MYTQKTREEKQTLIQKRAGERGPSRQGTQQGHYVELDSCHDEVHFTV